MKVWLRRILLLVLLLWKDGFSFQFHRHRRIIEAHQKVGAIGGKYYALIYWEYDLFPPGLMQPRRELCGGVIIGKNHLLSAAHCIEPYEKYVGPLKNLGKNNLFDQRKFEARVYFGNFSEDLGEFDKSSFEKTLESFAVEDMKVHEHYVYNNTHFLNDIGIIKVKGSFDPGITVRMCEAGDKSASMKLVVSGTGLDGNDVISRALKSAEVVEADKYFCENFDSLRTDPGSYVCTKGPSVCSGDSGGPLVLVNPATEEPVCLYGVVSHLIQGEEDVGQTGKQEGRKVWIQCLAADGIRYASVKYYSQWVKENIDQTISSE